MFVEIKMHNYTGTQKKSLQGKIRFGLSAESTSGETICDDEGRRGRGLTDIEIKNSRFVFFGGGGHVGGGVGASHTTAASKARKVCHGNRSITRRRWHPNKVHRKENFKPFVRVYRNRVKFRLSKEKKKRERGDRRSRTAGNG